MGLAGAEATAPSACFSKGDTMNEKSLDGFFRGRETSFAVAKRAQEDHRHLLDLTILLQAHPSGLRRWSIMRTMRKNRDMAGLPIPQKFEDAIECVFRNHCAASEYLKKQNSGQEKALFHWPQGKAARVMGGLT